MLRIVLIGLVFWSNVLLAEQTSRITPVIDKERLSDWLLRQPEHASSYPFGLVWLVPSSRLSQAQLKRKLLEKVDYAENVSSGAQENWGAFIKSLPVTGRVLVQSNDPRWLQAHPKEDRFWIAIIRYSSLPGQIQ